MAVGVFTHTNHYTGEHVRPGTAILPDRQCTRSGCSEHAAVTLSYDYGQSQVWLDPLSAEREPHAYDMCARHAARLSVPTGWQLEDRQSTLRLAEIRVA